MDDLIKKIQKWEMLGAWDKIIQELQQIKWWKRGPDEELALACAYLNRSEGDWKKRKDSERALKILEHKEEAMGDDYLYFVALGKAYFNLNQWGRAYLAFEIALDMEPPEKIEDSIYGWLVKCEEEMSKPLFYQTFQNRVEKSWRKFELSEREILNKFAQQTSGLARVDSKIESIFKIALFRPFPLLDRGNGIYKLTLTAHGSLMRCFALEYFKEQAPADFAKNWELQVGESKAKLTNLKPHDVENFYKGIIEDTIFWVEHEEDGIFTIGLHDSEWKKSKFETPKDVYEVMERTLIALLGEIVYEKYIRIYDMPDEVKFTGTMPLSDLPAYLKSKGVGLEASSTEILNKSTAYQRPPSNALLTLSGPREVIRGTSLCMKFIQDYEEGNEEELEALEADGISAGFLFYNLDTFKSENREKDRLEFRNSLKKTLEEKVGSASVKIIGEADGENFDYVDIFVWDLPKTLDVVIDFFNDSSVSFSAYRVFRIDAKAVVLSGDATLLEEEAMENEVSNFFFPDNKRVIH